MQHTTIQTAIMGFGNPCRSDDAVGVYVVDELKKQLPYHANISLLDMGTGAFEVLFQLKGHQKIILIDAVINSGEKPGTIFKLPAEEILRAPQDDPMVFLHSIKWDQALSYAKKILGSEYPSDISVYLIAINDTRLEMQLSEAVKVAGDKVVEWIKQEVEQTKSTEQKVQVTNLMKLQSGHIIIPASLAECLFGGSAQVNWVYYPQRHTLLVAPQHDELFKSLHKTSMSMLKMKNANGDRSISVQELLLDNEIENTDRDLNYTADERMCILSIMF